MAYSKPSTNLGFEKILNQQSTNMNIEDLKTTYSRLSTQTKDFTYYRTLQKDFPAIGFSSVESTPSELEKMYNIFYNMNLLDQEDVILLGLSLTHMMDGRLMAHIIFEAYCHKYNALLEQNSEIRSWISCMVHLLINETITKVCPDVQLKPWGPVDDVVIGNSFFDNRPVATRSYLDSPDNNASKNEKIFNPCRRVPRELETYISHIDRINTSPYLLHIGSMLHYIIPSCFTPLFMVITKGLASRYDINGSISIHQGFNVHMNKQVLWKLEQLEGYPDKYKIIPSRHFKNVIGNSTGGVPRADCLLVNTPHFVKCFRLNTCGFHPAEYTDSTDKLLYGVFKYASCVPIGTLGMDLDAANDATFFFEDSQNYRDYLNTQIKNNANRMEYTAATIAKKAKMDGYATDAVNIIINHFPNLPDVPYEPKQVIIEEVYTEVDNWLGYENEDLGY